jgi:hypothetical protein
VRGLEIPRINVRPSPIRCGQIDAFVEMDVIVELARLTRIRRLRGLTEFRPQVLSTAINPGATNCINFS